jgi:DNA invertase Pin-like site-specific DNA recombinase
MAKTLIKAVGYMRTSSATNVGPDKDSDKRQRIAIAGYAKANGYEVVDWYYDAAVSGADPINERNGFVEMLDRIMTNGAKTIIVESPDRFARDLTVQLAGHDFLTKAGIALVPASAPDFFTEDTPTAVLVRQVLGAINQFEKSTIVAKLKNARLRKRKANGNNKCEGRKSHVELNPSLVALVKQLRRKKPKGGQMSLRAIATELSAHGYLNEKRQPFNPKSIRAMLETTKTTRAALTVEAK